MTHTLPHVRGLNTNIVRNLDFVKRVLLPKVGIASTAVSTVKWRELFIHHPINTTLAMQYLIIFGYPYTFLFLIQVQAGGMNISPNNRVDERNKFQVSDPTTAAVETDLLISR